MLGNLEKRLIHGRVRRIGGFHIGKIDVHPGRLKAGEECSACRLEFFECGFKGLCRFRFLSGLQQTLADLEPGFGRGLMFGSLVNDDLKMRCGVRELALVEVAPAKPRLSDREKGRLFAGLGQNLKKSDSLIPCFAFVGGLGNGVDRAGNDRAVGVIIEKPADRQVRFLPVFCLARREREISQGLIAVGSGGIGLQIAVGRVLDSREIALGKRKV